jgi:hypothetical protein
MSESLWDHRLSKFQRARLAYLEATDGAVRDIAWEHPILEEFELGEGACIMEFDHMRVIVGKDGGMSPLPKIP